MSSVRIPTKPAGDSNLKPATHFKTKPAGVRTRSRPPERLLLGRGEWSS
jgi:hypothetical protein